MKVTRIMWYAGTVFTTLAMLAGSANLAGDGANALEVAVRGNGKSSFENIHAERRQLMGHAQLFVVMHGAAGRLFAVAQSGIEEDDLVWVNHKSWHSPSGLHHNAGL